MENKKELLKVTNDYVFKRIFGQKGKKISRTKRKGNKG